MTIRSAPPKHCSTMEPSASRCSPRSKCAAFPTGWIGKSTSVGWCKEPYTTPSTIRYAAKGMKEFQSPVWTESWFPDAFIGTMAQLLIALEDGTPPAISGRDNLKTMALVEAAYLSAAQFRSIGLDVILATSGTPVRAESKAQGLFSRLFSAPRNEADAPVQSSAVQAPLSNFTPRAQQ